MADWKALLTDVLLADGAIDPTETVLVKKALLADGNIDEEEVAFLVTLRKAAKRVCPEFNSFFFEALKANMLADGAIDIKEANLLRDIIFADGKVDDDEKAFLKELKAQAKSVSTEFDQLLAECLR